MLASLLASTSHGISYPNLYRNSAASPLARSTDARASAIDPVITQPTEGDSLKICETDDGSISLSCCAASAQISHTQDSRSTYWDFLLRQYHSAVLASDPNRCNIGGSDSFEGILCRHPYSKRLSDCLLRKGQSSVCWFTPWCSG